MDAGFSPRTGAQGMIMTEKFTLDERLVGLGLHVTDPAGDTLTFKRGEIEKFLELMDAAVARDDGVAFVVEMSAVGISDMDEQDLRVLLQDAVGEFSAARTPAYEYVKRRYGSIKDDVEFFDKVEEVQKRCRWAHNVGFLSIKAAK